MEAYLSALGDTNASRFNKSGRGLPVVSAYVQIVQIVTGGALTSIDGTSC